MRSHADKSIFSNSALRYLCLSDCLSVENLCFSRADINLIH